LLLRQWPKVAAVTADLRTTDGLHSQVQFHLHADQTDARWKAWSASTPNPAAVLAQLPANAVLAVGGGVHFGPLWETLQELMPEHDREGFQRGMRFARGFLGGRDLMQDVFPALLNDVGLTVVPSEQPGELIPFEAVLECRFPPAEKTRGLHLAL